MAASDFLRGMVDNVKHDYGNDVLEVYANRKAIQDQRKKDQEAMIADEKSTKRNAWLANAYREHTGEDGTVNYGGLSKSAADAGYGADLPSMMKDRTEMQGKLADAGKTTAETGKITQESRMDGRKTAIQAISQAKNPIEALQISKQFRGSMHPDDYTEMLDDLITTPQAEWAGHMQNLRTGLVSPDTQMTQETSIKNNQLNNYTSQVKNANDYSIDQSKVLNESEKLQLEQAKFEQSKAQYGLDYAMKERENDRKAALDASTSSKDRNAKSADASEVLSLLNQADLLMNDTTHSAVGNAVDTAIGAFGYSTTGGENAAKLKALEGSLIAKMPKMSGPQSDKDVLLYKQMAGQIGNANLPIAVRKAAMDSIREINQRQLNLQQSTYQGSDQPQQPSFKVQPSGRSNGYVINGKSYSGEQIEAYAKKNGMTASQAISIIEGHK